LSELRPQAQTRVTPVTFGLAQVLSNSGKGSG
jgi:hypothetical protein